MRSRITILIFQMLTAFLSSAAQEHSFQITITPADAMPGYKAFLCYKKFPGKITIDSVPYQSGKFSIKGSVTSQQAAVLYISPENSGFGRNLNTKPGMTVYLEQGDIKVVTRPGSKALSLSGTPLNDNYQEYVDLTVYFQEKEAVLAAKNAAAIARKDTKVSEKIEREYRTLLIKRHEQEENYFNNHLSSLVALDWLKNAEYLLQEKSRALVLFEKLDDNLKNSAAGKKYITLLKSRVSAEVGDAAPVFVAKNSKGESVSLQSFRGKFVLLDFWASWCIPCRRENPNLLSAYNKYKEKDFTILAFSLDEQNSAWLKAISQDAMPWTQVSDPAAFNGQTAISYGVTSIPSNVLIDPQGKIIARNLHGEELQKMLNKTL